MKRTSQPRTASLFPRAGACAIALLLTMAASSCIYESPRGDEFYRTLWTSDEVPLGPFDASKLTLEFLSGESVSIKTVTNSDETAGSSTYGTYAYDGLTATFKGLSLTYDAASIRTGTEGLEESSGGQERETFTVTFIEAHRNGDTLFLLWRVDSMLYPFTTAMRQLSSDE